MLLLTIPFDRTTMISINIISCMFLLCSCAVTSFIQSALPRHNLCIHHETTIFPRRPMSLLTSMTEDAEKLRQQAIKARTEALQLDTQLTSKKITTIEQKLENTAWDDRNIEEKSKLERQLEMLKDKLSSKSKDSATNVPPSESSSLLNNADSDTVPPHKETSSKLSTLSSDNPVAGFDEEDLALYVPVIEKLEAEASSNSTVDDLLKLFREAPELQEHFQKKIQEMFTVPIDDIKLLEEKQRSYLSSTSTVERAQLKREMEQLEKSIESNGPVGYSDTIFLDIPSMPDNELRCRSNAISELPNTLQALYKLQNDVNKDGDLELAILKEHYDLQLQLLDQIKYAPMNENSKSDVRKAIESLPSTIINDMRSASDVGDVAEDSVEALYKDLIEKWEKASKMQELDQIVMTGGAFQDVAAYNDIDFLDRSRYLKEFYPSIAKMEGSQPSSEEIDKFSKQVLDKIFMQTSSPERALGCYYIRGQNLQSEDEDGVKLMKRLNERYEKSSLAGKLDFFYVLDPSPLSDEAMEMGDGEEPIIIVTRRNWDVLYSSSNPLTKLSISCFGILSSIVFALAVCDLQPNIQSQLDNAIAGNFANIEWVADLAWLTAASLIGIHAFHEIGHASIAIRDRFQTTLPTMIPSIQLGLQGSITPIKSPPPNFRSLFDFAMAGPLFGMIASITILLQGLTLSVATPVTEISNLPALPTAFLRTSALGGSIIEFFFGSRNNILAGDLLRNSDVLPLHPLAIAGYVGLIANALALLPLGNTDGGRISLTMFGRRGAFVVKAFTALLVCLAGIFGFDDANILLVYVLFCIFCQRDLENPVQNEVEQLDFGRGAFAIVMAMMVGLTLCPMA